LTKQKMLDVLVYQYLNRLQESLSDTDRKAAMNQVNPKYVLRNYMSLAIEAAEKETIR
jgi:uncharacterized protein YdiU (UPF0061 family)